MCALVLDRWVKQIPAPEQVSGVAFHYDASSNQAPQTCLLAVTQEGEGWSLQLVLSTLLQTLYWADAGSLTRGPRRRRTIDPEHLRTGSDHAMDRGGALMATWQRLEGLCRSEAL